MLDTGYQIISIDCQAGLDSAELAAGYAGRNQAGAETCLTVFVIPGLTRNPVRINTITLLDAGSSPA
jgi:hypothetical protein